MPRNITSKTNSESNLTYFLWSSLSNCMQDAINNKTKYLGFKPWNRLSNGQWVPDNGNYDNLYGYCYKSSDNFNPESNFNPNGNIEIYSVPTTKNCAVVNDSNIGNCLSDSKNADLIRQMNQLSNEINTKNDALRKIKIQRYAMENNLTIDAATQQFNQKQQEYKLQKEKMELQDKLAILNKQYATLSSASNSANMQLSDKNRLLANVNSNIQKTYTRLMEINDKINTITQDIYTNNAEIERKDQIIKTMRSIITILFILILVMGIYYGTDNFKSKFPNSYNSLKNTFSTFRF